MYQRKLQTNIHNDATSEEKDPNNQVPFVGETLLDFLNAEYRISTDGITMGSFWNAPTASRGFGSFS